MLTKHILDNATSSEYLKDVLSYDNILCNCLRAIFDHCFSGQDKFIVHPETVEVANLGNFKEGGKFENAASHLSQYLLAECSDGDALLFDDVMADPDDEVEGLPGQRIAVAGQVYHLVDYTNLSEESLKKLIWACGVSWHFVCVRFEGIPTAGVMDFLADEDCRSVEQNIKELIVGAFDGEGFVHVRR